MNRICPYCGEPLPEDIHLNKVYCYDSNCYDKAKSIREKEKRKAEIEKLEKDAIDLQTQHFGSDGDYFQKRQELVKPIQDRVFTAMKKVAKREGYSFVFDKSNQSNLVYAEKEFDMSDSVLEEMGITK